MRTRRPLLLPFRAPHRFGFPPNVIVLRLCWSLRRGLSCHELKGLLTERGIEVDDVNIDRYV